MQSINSSNTSSNSCNCEGHSQTHLGFSSASGVTCILWSAQELVGLIEHRYDEPWTSLAQRVVRCVATACMAGYFLTETAHNHSN